MSLYAFTFGEAEVRVKLVGESEQTVGFAEDVSHSRRPELLEDGSAAFFVDTLTFTSPWVNSDVETFFKNKGPFQKVFVYFTNADDARLASVGVVDARVLSARHEGQEVRRYTFELEAYAHA